MKGKPREREGRGEPPLAPRTPTPPRRRGCGGDEAPGASSGLSRPSDPPAEGIDEQDQGSPDV